MQDYPQDMQRAAQCAADYRALAIQPSNLGMQAGSGVGKSPEQSEMHAALVKLDDALSTLGQVRSELRDRLDPALRAAVPQPTGSALNAIAPNRSSIGSHIHNAADGVYAEADSIRDMIARLAI